MGDNTLGLNEWIIVLDVMGWFYFKRLDMVVQNKSLAVAGVIALIVEDELRIDNEMFF